MYSKKVSLILTTYKGIDCIEECLIAALKQDYENFEVIVVDDNGIGTEEQIKTEEIVNKYKRNNLKYYAHDINKNGSAARNTGILNSDGYYISFLDDDDILYSNSISERIKELEKHNDEYGLVLTSFKLIRTGVKDEDIILDFDGDILANYLKKQYQSPSTTILTKKSVIEDVGLWDETFKRHQDWEFVTRILYKYRACSVKEITAEKRVLQRNYPYNPKIYEERRTFFLEKMIPYMDKITSKEKKEIFYLHYFDIAKEYFKNKNIVFTIKWCFKSKHFFRALFEIFKDAINYLKKSNRK